MNSGFWNDKSVFVTGHTGFKGGWLSHWLARLGAKVHGYSLDPGNDGPNLYNVSNVLGSVASSTFADVRDLEKLGGAIKRSRPDVIFHMAAQPLVLQSYDAPIETFQVNVIGTANLLQAIRDVDSVRAVVNVTTDKCYENREWVWPYRENDRLGGHDPYSASKACAELVSSSFQNSFFASQNIVIATVRAGNVIGGGDWAIDRLVPDFLRAYDNHEILSVRSPDAVRPWQHVLEPLRGYLILAENLYQKGERYCGPWNFGPDARDSKSVRYVVDHLCRLLPGARWTDVSGESRHEAHRLKLDITKSMSELNWSPSWSLDQGLTNTAKWHEAWKSGEDMSQVTMNQIKLYETSVSRWS
jgi:CDP-glucose 4,6-dehydratase